MAADAALGFAGVNLLLGLLVSLASAGAYAIWRVGDTCASTGDAMFALTAIPLFFFLLIVGVGSLLATMNEQNVERAQGKAMLGFLFLVLAAAPAVLSSIVWGAEIATGDLTVPTVVGGGTCTGELAPRYHDLKLPTAIAGVSSSALLALSALLLIRHLRRSLRLTVGDSRLVGQTP